MRDGSQADEGRKSIYKLSDQETPAKFAGKKVAINGTLFKKTNILKVDTITAVHLGRR